MHKIVITQRWQLQETECALHPCKISRNENAELWNWWKTECRPSAIVFATLRWVNSWHAFMSFVVGSHISANGNYQRPHVRVLDTQVSARHLVCQRPMDWRSRTPAPSDTIIYFFKHIFTCVDACELKQDFPLRRKHLITLSQPHSKRAEVDADTVRRIPKPIRISPPSCQSPRRIFAHKLS